MTSTPKTYVGNWADYPFQTIKNSASIAACSTSKIYQLLNHKKLVAMRLNGRTVVSTASIKTLLEQAKPWQPARHRVEKANKVRLGKLASAPSDRS
jgi:hypothetical protein